VATNQSARATTRETAATGDADYNRARGPEDGGREWCDQHGFVRRLTPFAYRKSDPVTVGEYLSREIASLRPTAATFAPEDAFPDDYTYDPAVVKYHLQLRGSWRIGTAGRPKYVNPNYVHLGSNDPNTVTDTSERTEILDRMARSGIPRLSDLAPMFGLSTADLREFCRENDGGGRDRWLSGRRRAARTCRLAVEWGYSERAVADALPVANSVVYHWLRGPGALDWVPTDPSLGVDAARETTGDRAGGRL